MIIFGGKTYERTAGAASAPQNAGRCLRPAASSGEGQVFRRTIESGRIPNMIFYGPSGTGKTTVAASSPRTAA